MDYNASTDNENGELETYVNWLERQLLSRIEQLDKIEQVNGDNAKKSSCNRPHVSVSVLSDKLKSMRYTEAQKEERTDEGLQEVFGWEICLNEIESWLRAYCTER